MRPNHPTPTAHESEKTANDTPASSDDSRATLETSPYSRLLGVIAASVATAVLVTSCAFGSDSVSATGTAEDGEDPSRELVLEGALEPGHDPFTASVAAAEPDDSDVSDVTHDSITVDDTEAANALATVDGTAPGLYGGTGDGRTCDPDALVDFLTADPQKAQAWSEAIGIDRSDIETYVQSLAPVVLLHDTRVTNHGYRDGHATPFQSVLQAGTAVLVDDQGVPRVRCECGNPLDEPAPIPSEPTHVGTPWPGFGETPTVVVEPGAPVVVIIVIDIDLDVEIEVPVGDEQVGDPHEDDDDSDADGDADPDDDETDADGRPDQGTVPERDASTCLARYAELVVLLTPLGIDPLEASQWATDAEAAATLIDNGQYDEATTIICGLVDEMEAVYAGLGGG